MEAKEKGYKVREYNCPVKRYCQTLDLKDDPALIAEYKNAIVNPSIGRSSAKEYVKWVFSKWRFIL